MAELNVYISDVMKREMEYVGGIDWDRIIHETIWRKLSEAKKRIKKEEKQTNWENDY